MLCIVFIYRKEISEENNLHIFINCVNILQQAKVLNSLKKQKDKYLLDLKKLDNLYIKCTIPGFY